ncbi:MAG: bacteriohemerythrin [Calditrichia bacterium]
MGYLNQLFEAMRAGNGNEVPEKILNDLISYTNTHFASEEKLMQAHGFPGKIAHTQEHREPTRQVMDIRHQLRNGGLGLSTRVSSFLKEWLSNHILGTDKAYGFFLYKKGVY